MKKVIAFALSTLLLLSLCSCGTNYAEELDGTWIEHEYCTSDEAEEYLTSLQFYDSEIACADLDGFYLIYAVTFDAEAKTYTLGYDVDRSCEGIGAYLDSVFEALYENRSTIEEYYGEADSCASVEEFEQWYVENLYTGYSDYAALQSDMIDYYMESYTFTAETGTFTADSKEIDCTADGESETYKLDYTLKDGELTLEFSNSTDVFTHA